MIPHKKALFELNKQENRKFSESKEFGLSHTDMIINDDFSESILESVT